MTTDWSSYLNSENISIDTHVVKVWSALGHTIGVFFVHTNGERFEVWVVPKTRSWEVPDRCTQLGCDIVGIPTSSSGWRDDASLLGVFHESSLPMLYRSSEGSGS